MKTIVAVLAAAVYLEAVAFGYDLGTFENPSPLARPRFRYWVPDAYVNLSTVRNDIADAGSIGAGPLQSLFRGHGIPGANVTFISQEAWNCWDTSTTVTFKTVQA